MKLTNKPAVRFLRTHRRAVIVVLLCVGVIGVLGGYGLWSKYVWDGYQTRYVALQNDVHTQLGATLALRADTQQERRVKVASFGKLTTTITSTEGTLCQVNQLVGWQRSFADLHRREEQCRKTQQSLLQLRDKLKNVVGYLQNDQALAGHLATIHTQPELSEGEWEGQLAAWRTAANAIKTMPVEKAFAPVQQAAATASQGVVAAWEEVIAAHQAKDKARYLKAVDALAQAYGALSALQATSSLQLKGVSGEFQSAASGVVASR